MRNVPILVTMTAFGGKIVSTIAAAPENAHALTSDGSVFAFGSNSNFQVSSNLFLYSQIV
jgi:alpha-tubulin suppressor-like RCC1 family protein